jgi:hypothetical protein
MPDTVRTKVELQTRLANNTTGDITAQTIRDMLVTMFANGSLVDTRASASALTASHGTVVWCTEVSAPYKWDSSDLGAGDGWTRLKANDGTPGTWVVQSGPSFGLVPKKSFGATTKIMWLGDSNTVGSNGDETGFVGGWRQATYQRLREWRSDFDLIGANITTPESNSFGLWFHSATAGYKIEDLTSGFAAYVASAGAPDLIIDSIGTNNITASDSLGTMQTKRAALDAAYLANAPNATVIVMPVIPFVAGTTTGSNLATWNAARDAYNAWLLTYARAKSNYHYLDSSSQLALGEYQRDGVHLTRGGQASVAEVISTYLDQRVLGPRFGDTLPRSFKQRKYASAIALATSSTDGLTCAAHSGFNPGTGSFALALDYYPTDVTSGLRSIAQFASYTSNPTAFFGLYQDGRLLSVYWANQGGTIYDASHGHAVPTTALMLNKWHRIVMIAHQPSGTVGLYINANLVGLVQGVSAWTFSSATFYLGKSPEFSSSLGLVGRVHAYKGAGIPRPGTMAALLAVEGDHYNERPIASGYQSASFALATSLTDNINGNPSMSLVGGAAAAGAYPSSATPLRPWEYQPDVTLGDLKVIGDGAPTFNIASGGLGSGGTVTLEPGSTNFGGVVQLNTGTGPAGVGLIEVDFSSVIPGQSPIILASLMDGSTDAWSSAATVVVERVGAASLNSKMYLVWRNGGSNLTASKTDGWRIAYLVVQK